ncbi:hypothetical protein JRO89_XS01G0173800 [Xanthoceras sorbifolium]|uniref:LanC-like protein GCL2 n=1 Tax=Xanthoceras sorbifolium TaxID=99658 RepID=A0ABQ8IJN6_9ROSI|nr:hypothetical protein JRO89_XS01G0173800 [Xanthoceras sorbifolium]
MADRFFPNVVVETWGLTGQHVQDFTLYCGALGTAFLLFKAYQVAQNKNDLDLCLEIIKSCDSSSLPSREVTFLCGRAGVCALGAVAAKYAVVEEIIENGRRLAKKGGPPLMFEWNGEKYWGAAHGLAGIMHVLMDMELKPDEAEDVKGTLKYMIKNRLPSGNYPVSEEDAKRDVLVHWCHGAPGVGLTLAKAAKVFEDTEFLAAAADAAEVVWNRGLLKRVGICHGISGNAYLFLALYHITGNLEFLYRAKAFACFLLDRAHKVIAKGEIHGGDNPYSLFEGVGGMAYLFLDMCEPSKARFPAYDL